MPKTKKSESAMELLVGVSEQEDKELAERTKVPASNNDLVLLAEEMLNTKTEIDRLTAEAKQYTDRYNQIRTRELPEKMKELGYVNSSGKSSFTFAGGKIHLETKLSASCASANQPVLYDWLNKNNAADMIKQVVHPSTLTAFVKERRAEGLEDPPGISVWEETKAKLTGTKS